MKTNNKGFSLVELIVVIAIMAILVAVAIPTFAGFINKANKASDDQFMADAEYAVVLANTKNPNYVIQSVTVTTGTFALSYKYYVDADMDGVQDEGETTTTVTSGAEHADALAVLDTTYTFKYYKENNATIANGVVTD